ncbi:nuclear transport factor 2 family protein [Microbacterium oxydans]|nr:nuclear transport factor 2 family protein [Microbacterium oxydans]
MSAIDVVGQYGAAMAAGDMEALAATFHPDAVWHQPGANQLSGDHVGPDAIIAHLGRFMQLSGARSPSRRSRRPRAVPWYPPPCDSARSAWGTMTSISTFSISTVSTCSVSPTAASSRSG